MATLNFSMQIPKAAPDAPGDDAPDGSFPVARYREDFPILSTEVRGKPLVYLDNAATSQTPLAVIDRIRDYYLYENANVHRGVHYLSQTATDSYEQARESCRRFLNAASEREVIFTRGTTEAINLVAQSFVRPRLQAGDSVLISTLEHHSNIVPWQLVCESAGATVKVIPINDAGELDMAAAATLLDTPGMRFLSVGHVSNALGTINPVAELVTLAHARGIPVMLDGAQAAPHEIIDVQALDCDFYAMSGHKVYGPTGIGLLYGKEAHLAAMPPYHGGGDMIAKVTFEKSTWNELPYKFEAGTPNIAGSIALGAALDYVTAIGLPRIAAYEHELLLYATEALSAIPDLRIVGTAAHKASVVSFVMKGLHPHDIGTIVDSEGVAIRAGHHCAQPLMQRLGVHATARASFAFYNTREEIDTLVAALHKVRKLFG